MPKNEDFLLKHFMPYFQAGEQIIWLGEHQNNLFKLMAGTILKTTFYILLVGLPILTIFLIDKLAIIPFMLLFFITCFVLPVIIKTKFLYPSRTFYAVTNQRILSLGLSGFKPYSLILLQDAILSKPRNGTVDILLYNKHNPTGELPQPIGILEGIAEDEAQTAYELLRQAREDALNTRAQQLGID